MRHNGPYSVYSACSLSKLALAPLIISLITGMPNPSANAQGDTSDAGYTHRVEAVVSTERNAQWNQLVANCTVTVQLVDPGSPGLPANGEITITIPQFTIEAQGGTSDPGIWNDKCHSNETATAWPNKLDCKFSSGSNNKGAWSSFIDPKFAKQAIADAKNKFKNQNLNIPAPAAAGNEQMDADKAKNFPKNDKKHSDDKDNTGKEIKPPAKREGYTQDFKAPKTAVSLTVSGRKCTAPEAAQK